MRSSGVLLLLLAVPCCLPAQQFRIAEPGYRYEFPRDHFDHPDYQTEWWYYTGNLRAANGRRYGFELTFFRQAQRIPAEARARMSETWVPAQVFLAHLALSDIDGGHFYHSERLNRAGPGLAGGSLPGARYWNGNWQVRWTPDLGGKQNLRAVAERFTLELALDPRKPAVIQGENGIDRKGPAPGEASHYISFTRLRAQGRLTLNGSPAVAVAGSAWMDHEFFTEAPSRELAGWDWFAIQLDTGEDLMLYRLRLRSAAPDPYSSGTFIDTRGNARHLSAADFRLTPGAPWQSPHTHARYPGEWNISVPSLGLEMIERNDLPDQELWAAEGAIPAYWEGAVSYQGRRQGQAVKGVGYLEMTGYEKPVNLSGTDQK